MQYNRQNMMKTIDTDNNKTKRTALYLPRKHFLYKIVKQFCGLPVDDIINFHNITKLLYRPTDPASLGVSRALFGLCMVIDVIEERGFADIDLKWGDPNSCHFPLIHGMEPLSLPWMILLYTTMWAGAFGIMLGFYFKVACACFTIPYWYIFILDKSFWNNHSYLYGIIAILFWGTGANKYFAIDTNTKANDKTVPLWNYFILKFQLFVLYFLAGLKKSSKEWLEGYSMTNLSNHWVFNPFKIFLTTEQTDFFIVHWFGFIFDLTVGFLILFDRTRLPAMIFCITFHFMNSRLFSIGMFPYVCLVTMPLFCHVDWPRKVQDWINDNVKRYICEINKCEKCIFPYKGNLKNLKPKDEIKTKFTECNSLKCDIKSRNNKNCENKTDDAAQKFEETELCSNVNLLKNDETNSRENNIIRQDEAQANCYCNEKQSISACEIHSHKTRIKSEKIFKKQKCVIIYLLCHIILQFFLPYSHFITKGYNNWVPGLYGYSWDMMVHSWDTILVVIKVHDNDKNEDHYINPQAWIQNDRWQKHGDMLKQYAHCIEKNLMLQKQKALTFNHSNKNMEQLAKLSSNISIYIDVWCSLNGRFQQRMFNSTVDLLTADWHLLKPVSYVMPLLTQYSSYRYKFDQIQQQVYMWSNYTDVLFVADYPGMYLENYINDDLTNVSLTVLEGTVIYTEEKMKEMKRIDKGNSVNVATQRFHKVQVSSHYPACYMYTFTNGTKLRLANKGKLKKREVKYSLSFLKELKYKMNAWVRTFSHIANAFFYFVYNVPMLRRVHMTK